MSKIDTGNAIIPTGYARVGQRVQIGGVVGTMDGLTHTAGIRRVHATSPEGFELLELLDKSKRAKRNGGRGWYGIGAYVDGMRVAYSVGTRTGCSV